MPESSKLLGTGETRRARPDHRDPPSGAALAHLRNDPAFAPAAVDDLAFDRLDRHRCVDEVERARRLARRGADATGEFGKIIGRVKLLQRAAPIVQADEVVPVGDKIIDRAAGVAERNPAFHAARRLRANLGHGWGRDELVPVRHALGHRRQRALVAIDFEEGGGARHRLTPPPRPTGCRRFRVQAMRGDIRAAPA